MQERFCLEYLTDLNAKQAAIRAGYSEKTAEQAGFQLLRHPKVSSVIQTKLRAHLTRLDLRADDVLEGLRRIIAADPAEVVDEHNQPRYLREIPSDVRMAIDAFELDEQGRVVKIKLSPKHEALKTLAQHFNLLQPDVLLPPPSDALSLTQVNVTNIRLDLLSLEELRVLKRVMASQGPSPAPADGERPPS